MRTAMMLGRLRRHGRRTPPPPVTLPEDPGPGPDPAVAAGWLRQDSLWAGREIAGGQPERDIAYQLIATCGYVASYLEGREADEADGMSTIRYVPVRRQPAAGPSGIAGGWPR
jgi:hypothetical protein